MGTGSLLSVMLGYLSNMLFFLSGLLLRSLIRFIGEIPDRFYFNIFIKGSNIDIVCPQIAIPQYDPQVVNQIIEIPPNVYLMPFAEAASIAELKSFIEKIFK